MSRELYRKTCAKCNITAAKDKNLSFHRFPLPGKHGISRIRVWAEYCYPDEDWSDEKSLKDLHFQHKMVCSRHFNDSCYTNSARTRLNIFAIPSGTQAQGFLKDTNVSVDIPQDSHTSDLEIKANNNYNYDLNKGENYERDTLTVEVPDVKPKLECIEQNSLVTNDTPPPDLQSRLLVFEDEFDYFGKNVAEQLRTLPLLVALKTQEMLLSVLKKQRLKVLHNSDPLSHN